MSRRPPNAAADRAAQNQATIKTLLKLESNKTCADCKRNKHPRWASWNLGIFICIRCSGIHRGMGTHISRVKSVDLDAWTDEQLQSVVQWGNGRANKYWEAKLAPGHIPSESKIENFIRTKYESKRWVMDGDKPDPSTLDDGTEQQIPSAVAQDKSRLSQASQSATTTAPKRPTQTQSIDLFGDDPPPPAARPSTTTPSNSGFAPAPKQSANAPAGVPPKQIKQGDSLLGLDFLGNSAPPRPASASASSNPSSTGPSRPDLKQSILSLYASAPKPQSAARPQPQTQAPIPQQQSSAFGGLNDDFSGLVINSNNSKVNPQTSAKSSPFANLGNSNVGGKSTGSQISSGGGNFFNTSAQPTYSTASTSTATQKQRTFSNSSFGAWDSGPTAAPKPTTTPSTTNPPSSSAFGDMFDFSQPSRPAAVPQSAAKPTPEVKSPFNLSKPAPPVQSNAQATASNSSKPAVSVGDPFGSNDVWGSPDTQVQPSVQATAPKPNHIPLASSFTWSNNNDVGGGFGSEAATTQPKVAPDEDFGGWSSAAPVSPSNNTLPQAQSSSKPPTSGGFGGSEDLFDNVWG